MQTHTALCVFEPFDWWRLNPPGNYRASDRVENLIKGRAKARILVRTQICNPNHLITTNSFERLTDSIAPDGVLTVCFLNGESNTRSWLGVIRNQRQFEMLKRLSERILVEAVIILGTDELEEITENAQRGTLENGAEVGCFVTAKQLSAHLVED